MPAAFIWMLPSFEAGWWSALLAGKLTGRDKQKTRDLLIYGSRPRTHLPIIDEKLRMAAGSATRTQAWTAKKLTMLLRWLANTTAVEHVILLAIKRMWPKAKQSDEVTLCL